MDSLSPAGSTVNTVKRRKRFLLLLLLTTVAVAGFILIRRSSNLKWFVSQPIDSKGHRIHLLIPENWTTSRGKSDSRLWVAMWPKPVNRDTNLVETWLQNLHLRPADEPDEGIVLEVGTDLCQEWNTHLHAAFKPDGEVYTFSARNSGIDYMIRAIPIPGTDKQAAVVYQFFEPPRARRDMAGAICTSLYIE